MTPQEIRIAVAEVVGWEWWTHPEGTPKLTKCRDDAQRNYYFSNGCFITQRPLDAAISENNSVPHYESDLNAMHEAEKTLVNTYEYQLYLDRLTNRDGWHATALQRAEAFLRVVGRWKETTI